jgi:hypothetical protein
MGCMPLCLNEVECKLCALNRGVEQLAARRAHNPEVTGSNPVPATKTQRVLLQRKALFFMDAAHDSQTLK